jgi:hypothetical protein
MRSGGWQSSVRLRFWLLAPFALAASARAATVTWSAPPECDDPRQTTEEAERLLGRSLAEIQAVDFEVNVARAGERDWSATLVTISQPSHERRERVLRGTSCNEVTAAAGVALAMVVDASEQKPHTEEAPAAEPVNHPEETPPVVGPPPAATQRARAIPPLAPPPRLGAAFSVGLVGDVGSLPAVAPGGEGAASLRYGSWNSRRSATSTFQRKNTS